MVERLRNFGYKVVILLQGKIYEIDKIEPARLPPCEHNCTYGRSCRMFSSGNWEELHRVSNNIAVIIGFTCGFSFHQERLKFTVIFIKQ